MPVFEVERSLGANNLQVLLVGGIHGDEPAGVEAAVRWMNVQGWQIVGQLTGWFSRARILADGRTTAAPTQLIMILNRSFNLGECCVDEIQIIRATLAGRRFLFSMDFHEDRDAPGYYICEIKARPPFAGERLIKAVESVLPIWDVPGSTDVTSPHVDVSDARPCRTRYCFAVVSGLWSFICCVTTPSTRFAAKRHYLSRWSKECVLTTQRWKPPSMLSLKTTPPLPHGTDHPALREPFSPNPNIP